MGAGTSSQVIGEIDGSKTSASRNGISIVADRITGAGRGLAGSGSVKQKVGVLSAGGRDNSIDMIAGNITASGTGVLGKGTSVENIGVIDTPNASDIHLNITTGDISTSAVGLYSKAEIDIGWISGTPDGGVDAMITVGDIDDKILGADASAIIEVGDVSGDVDGFTTIRITTGDLSADVEAGFNAKDGDLGIWIGNVKGHVKGNADVSVKARDIKHNKVTAIGCLGGRLSQ